RRKRWAGPTRSATARGGEDRGARAKDNARSEDRASLSALSLAPKGRLVRSVRAGAGRVAVVAGRVAVVAGGVARAGGRGVAHRRGGVHRTVGRATVQVGGLL